jgi:hypothetical protein
MNELGVAGIESGKKRLEPEATGCPLQATRIPASLEPDDELVLPKPKRAVTRYIAKDGGQTQLYFDYGEKEIVFDDPNLFAFGEALASRSRFVAKSATTWGKGYGWPLVRELLEQLLDEGILRHAGAVESAPIGANGVCPSPLPPAQTTTPRSWFECEAITRELTGRAVELGYLELIVPIYRVAHIALDAEGRQVGEANVFPSRLRLDVPTHWRTCQHAGSRYQDERPMNVTALKTMRAHWTPMMAALLHIREAYLRRFPKARSGWTVGDLQRLSTLVLTLPAYLMMRAQDRVENGALHPVLSSMFRVTDGVRMTMHDMLFIPITEPTRPPDAPITSDEIYAYAERTGSFLSDYGVCAGPRVMIEEFLRVLVDGKPIEGADAAALDPAVQAALAMLEPAVDYALYGLQAHAVVFSLWPLMSRAYEQLWTIVEPLRGDRSTALGALRNNLHGNVDYMQHTLLKTEAWRQSRERVLADMYEQCAIGLDAPLSQTLSERIAPASMAQHADAAGRLRAILQRRFADSAGAGVVVTPMVDTLMTYFRQEQAIVAAASEIQARTNELLVRTAPLRPFAASDADLYYRMQQDTERQLPYLVSELESVLGMRISVTRDAIDVADRAAC